MGPSGPPGPRGDVGDTGATGASGMSGSTGLSGNLPVVHSISKRQSCVSYRGPRGRLHALVGRRQVHFQPKSIRQ